MKKLLTLYLICCSLISKADFWTQKTNFPGVGRRVPISFSILNKGYVGCGYINSNIVNDFWEYDPATSVWTQKANCGGNARWNGISFSIGNKGYAGAGLTQVGFVTDFWEYDPALNIWIQKANFGGGTRTATLSLSINGKGYVTTGQDNTSAILNDMWEYDPILDTWTQKASLPGAGRVGAVGFSIGQIGYVISGGIVGTSGLIIAQDFWEYIPLFDLWIAMPVLPFSGRGDAAGFAICGKGYIATGDTFGFPRLKDLWEYNPVSSSWNQKTDYGGQPTDETAFFSIGTKGYIGLGCDDTLMSEFWEYTPDSVCTTGIDEVSSANFQFSVLPNPAKDFITINYSFNEIEKLNLTIINIEGIVIYESQLLQSTISLKDFSKGIYFVEVSDGKQKTVKKFVKK
jgi:type IX secretion system substrate protein/Kelch motif protein